LNSLHIKIDDESSENPIEKTMRVMYFEDIKDNTALLINHNPLPSSSPLSLSSSASTNNSTKEVINEEGFFFLVVCWDRLNE
jgi:hypothetical protein